MSNEYEFVIRGDSTIPEGRERALRRMHAILANFQRGVPDRANCFFYGLVKGWVLSEVIGHADADEIDALLPPRPSDGVISAIPYGRGVHAPEVEALTDDEVLGGTCFTAWMGIKNDLYYFALNGKSMPERSVLAWLGYLRGQLEGSGITQAEYNDLRSLLPAVHDDLTPLLSATD